MISRFTPTPAVQRVLLGVAATLICTGGVYVFGRRLDAAYPLSEWLIWSLLPVWGCALLFNLACVVLGSFLTRRLLQDRQLAALERLLLSMTLGLVAFVLALYLLGFCRLFKPVVAVMLPLAFIAVGYRDARALWHELVEWRAGIAPPKATERLLGSLAVLAGGGLLLFMYVEALDVSAINFDAAWYHFPIAQDYARIGRIVAFPGENHRAFPHLTSMLHTWALLMPKLPHTPQHWMLSLHLEYAIVLWRVVGAAALARHLLGGRDVRGLWAGFFLFSSIFVYDQNIGGSADHFLGFFAVPIALAALRALERFDVRWCVLLGVALGGHVLVKYQGVYLFVAITLVAGFRLVFLLGRYWWRSRQQRLAPEDVPWRALLRGLGALALAFTLVSSAHFAKNAVFYKNPVYPFAQSIFKASEPKRQPGFYAETPIREAFSPRGEGLARQAWALRKMFDYSLNTANRGLTKHRPYMGSLFSLLLPCALLVPTRRRYGALLAIVTLAFLVWANSAPNDRYLLSFHDLCIGTALALMVQVWELGWAARVGLVPLVLLQTVWSGDAMLFYGKKRLDAAIDMVSAGYEGKYDSRFNERSTQAQITAATPKHAVILARNYKGLLGLNRTVLSDVRAAQDYISYSHLKDTRDFFDVLAARGVTHLLYPKGDRKPSRWNNTILFTDLFVRHAKNVKRFGRLQLGELPSSPPPRATPYWVVVSGIRGVSDGIYGVEQLDFNPRGPERFSPRPRPRRALSAASEVLPDVQAIVMGRRRPKELSAQQLAEFESVESWDGEELWLRTR
jgi:hypothetical protein